MFNQPYQLNCQTEDDFKLKAKMLCRQLLDSSSWKRASVEQIRCSRIKTGQSNRLYICELISCECEINQQQHHSHDDFCSSSSLSSSSSSSFSSSEEEVLPITRNSHENTSTFNKVIVRFYGSEFTGEGNRYKSISDDLECQILNHLSSKGMAPKIYATFVGGRIDEFLDEATLGTIETLRSPPYLRILARKIAHCHALKIDLPGPIDYNQLLKSMESRSKCQITCTRKPLDDLQLKLFTKIVDFLHSERSNIITDKMIYLKQRQVFAHMDLNPTNFLFLPIQNQGRQSMDIMLIDFENCQLGCRGMDLGKFFVELSCTDDNYMISRVSASSPNPISDSKIREFIRSYLTEWSTISDDFQPSLDNEHNLFEEIKFGLMFTLICHIYWNVLHSDFTSIKMLTETVKKINLYHHFKQRWFE